MKKKNNSFKLVVMAVLVFGLIFGVVTITQNWGKNPRTVDSETAMRKLDNLYSKLFVNKPAPKPDPTFQGNDESAEKIAVLPDISEYPFIVNPTTDNFLTVYASAEKSDWMIDVANTFNKSGATVDGKPVSVGVRAIPSALAADFISSGKYTPDVYIPTSEIYGNLLGNAGIEATLVEKRLAGNAAGIVISKKKNDGLGASTGAAIIDSVLDGKLALGYTTPLSNENGFTFILTLLSHFDSSDPLSTTAIGGLQQFQDKILFISYDNDQLKSSLNGGTLDAIVLDYQEYNSSPNLKSAYDFIPFGTRQDSPVYTIGQLPELKKQIVSQFADFCKTPDSQGAATTRGFNGLDDYTGAAVLPGDAIAKVQEIYQKEKNGTSDLTVVFVVDVSGSMEGAPMLNLKASLNRTIGIISSNANVGLVTFSDDVTIAVPIGKFDNTQRSYFSYAAKNLIAGGGTAMFDAVVVGQKMLMDAKAANPNTKVLLFVLTDGEANRGMGFSDIESMTRGLKIPVYTIGYNANIEILQELSNINEAATMNADSDNVIYRLESLFNAQM